MEYRQQNLFGSVVVDHASVAPSTSQAKPPVEPEETEPLTRSRPFTPATPLCGKDCGSGAEVEERRDRLWEEREGVA